MHSAYWFIYEGLPGFKKLRQPQLDDWRSDKAFVNSFLTGVNRMVGNFYICIVGDISFSLVCFTSQIVRMVRSLNKIKNQGCNSVHFSLKSKLGRLSSIFPILEPKILAWTLFWKVSLLKQWNQDFAVDLIAIVIRNWNNQKLRDEKSINLYVFIHYMLCFHYDQSFIKAEPSMFKCSNVSRCSKTKLEGCWVRQGDSGEGEQGTQRLARGPCQAHGQETKKLLSGQTHATS